MSLPETKNPSTPPPPSSGRRMVRSTEMYERACDIMVGGVNSPVRAFRQVGGTPVVFKNGKGAAFSDVDGNRYIDFCLSWGPLILGHSAPEVIEAVQQAVGEGLSFGAPHGREVQLAERILAAYPEMDRVRFTSSGTEAVIAALRLARGVTGRSLVLKFEGCHHGDVDSLLVKSGSELVSQGIADGAGVPAPVANLTLVVSLDDDAALEKAFAENGERLAAVIIEPMPAQHGLLLQRDEFLKKLRTLCDANGTLLIFDEVISGLRLRYGGYGHGVGVKPDLVALGKIIGGGMPVGALVGGAQVMEQLAPVGPVHQAGTLGGNPISMAAGRACLDELANGGAYTELETLGQHLDARFAEIQAQVPWFHWIRKGSVFWLHLSEGPMPRRADRVDPKAVERFNALHGKLLDRGVYLSPSAFEVGYLSTAHGVQDIDRLADSLETECLALHEQDAETTDS